MLQHDHHKALISGLNRISMQIQGVCEGSGLQSQAGVLFLVSVSMVLGYSTFYKETQIYFNWLLFLHNRKFYEGRCDFNLPLDRLTGILFKR